MRVTLYRFILTGTVVFGSLLLACGDEEKGEQLVKDSKLIYQECTKSVECKGDMQCLNTHHGTICTNECGNMGSGFLSVGIKKNELYKGNCIKAPKVTSSDCEGGCCYISRIQYASNAPDSINMAWIGGTCYPKAP